MQGVQLVTAATLLQQTVAATCCETSKACKVSLNPNWFPPRSPYGLIQEDLYPREWLILVACLLLNQTQRKQVERVLPKFVHDWSTPKAFLASDSGQVAHLIRPLGFVNRRGRNLRLMTEAFLEGNWSDARQLPGCGEYAGRAHDIFCRGIIGNEEPKDHALVKWWKWYQLNFVQNVSNSAL